MRSAPTGTYPPESDFATGTRSGSSPQCSNAKSLPVLEIAGRRQRAALALDRLDDEERDVLGPERLLERVEVAERHAVEAGQERAEAAGERVVPVRRERAEGEPVEGARRRDD